MAAEKPEDAPETSEDAPEAPTPEKGSEAPTPEKAEKKARAAKKPDAAAAADAKAEAKADDAEKPKRARKAKAQKAEEASKEAKAAGDEAEKPEKPKRSGAKKQPEAEKPEKAEPKRKAPAAPISGTRPVVRAQARYVRTSARKARMVCGHLRGKSVVEARAILAFTPRAVARDWSKLLESAVANAENNHELVEEDLVVGEAYADEGPTIKRFRPRARGRAAPIRKRTSHLTITLTPGD